MEGLMEKSPLSLPLRAKVEERKSDPLKGA